MPCALEQAYAHPQCDCLDFEAMHKWALKQFMRIVAHGRHLGTHLEERHLQQFIFSTPPEPPAPVQPRFCRCGQEPCPHPIHVHADMPGLVEGDDGMYTPINRFKRSAQEVVVDELPEQFQRSLALFIADLNGCASLEKGWIAAQLFAEKFAILVSHKPTTSLLATSGAHHQSCCTTTPGGSYEDSVLPRVVYKTHTMQLSWHNRNGDLVV